MVCTGLPVVCDRLWSLPVLVTTLVYLAIYLKVGISVSVQSEHSTFVSMWQSLGSPHHLNDLTTVADKLTAYCLAS